MRLSELHAKFTQVIPLADGIFTGLTYVCPNDPRRKRGHAVLFTPPINPYDEHELRFDWVAALNTNEGWRVQPKWNRVGTTIDTLTLTPSVAFACCHINITNGEIA